ncbi:MAG: hypothetical protein A3I68_01180 [Candidatus Melainabacteria bacterium RIFCSPLOWO2_02_FULL_35_15]|nr:MAG: hypothetical protein A3F80_09065 [Candidatus Melainabacteria bacterium RIFCSPLOWO2_12_FULL_35_11]OGI13386.1 MAG: hypothetical protein A3I68_01180 [Candidatus Melainabacteria bacterium RIFCSPLOWO2_02_FULL_35_15]
MAKHNKIFKTVTVKKFYLLAFLFFFLSISSSQAQSDSPIYINPSYIQIQQSGTAVAAVTGIDLNNAVIKINGSGIFGFISEQNPDGTQLQVQFSAQPTAELGEREFFIKTETQEAKFIIKVIPSGAPTVESIYPNSAKPGKTFFLKLFGMGFIPGTNVISNYFSVSSYASTPDGSVLVVSLSISPELEPGTYPIYINNPSGQQAQADFTVSGSDTAENTDSFNVDPYSPGIYSIELSSANKNQIVIKGSMFDPDPYKNTVTLLENKDNTVTGRPVEVAYSDNDEIIINLPDDISSNSISFAVSSADGKSSNIKTVNLDTLQLSTAHSSDTAQTTPESNTASVIASQPAQIINTTTITEGSTHNKPENNLQEINKTEVTINEKIPVKPAITEDSDVIKNIQNISQYLFNSSAIDSNKDLTVPSLEEVKDPVKLISAIEENKQIKNQVDLITTALNGAKQNQELSNTLKKAEVLKTKVDELEKLLSAEKQKNKPDLKKLAQYEKLLASADAESRSQTFTLLNKLLKYKPQLKNLLTQKPLDLATVQPNIPNNAVILQYVPTEEGLIIFAVDNKNLKTRINKNISKDILNREVQSYKQLFENEIEKIKLTGRVTPISNWKNDKSNTYKKEILPLKEKAVFLYNALIGPVEKDIANKKVIAIIANGWLRYLPFQSLAKPTSDGDLRFLVSDKSIVYLDSVIAVSRNQSPELTNMANITVFANPDGTLTGANKEAELISKLFSKTTMSLVQQPFNVSLINQLAKKADILHLATHGHLDGSDIDSSFLISGKTKAGSKFTQGKLYLKDIYDLNLSNSKLIVLSGCDTGRVGNLLNEPDDIVGSLASAFRVAGANTILASLWRAHDEATKIIMQNFYENISLGLDKAESLRRAELKVKENPKYGHPLFWGLFSLIGDWR